MIRPVSILLRLARRLADALPSSDARTRALLLCEAGARAPAWLRRTATRVDVGQWFMDGRIWVAGLPGPDAALLVAAAGRQPLLARLPAAALAQSFYNAVGGELVLQPAPGAPVSRLALPPVEAEEVLAWVRCSDEPRAALPPSRFPLHTSPSPAPGDPPCSS